MNDRSPDSGEDLSTPPADLIPSPRKVNVAITGRCNLQCKYCFYSGEMAALGDLPTGRWLAFFDELGSLALHRVTLTGGEVFTRSDLFDLIDGIIANRMRYALLTNGTLITPETIDQLKSGKRCVRLDFVQVSIDGSRAEVHDQSRPNSFDRALRGLRLLQEAGLPVTARVTLNPYNVDDLENIAHLLLEEVGLRSFSTNETFPMGSAGCYGKRVVLSRAERGRAMEMLTALNKRYENRIQAQAGPLAMARQLEEIKRRMERGETTMEGCGTLSACGAVLEKIDVQHDGTIVPCHLLSNYPLGMIGEVSLQEIWQHHPSLNRVRQRRTIPVRSLATCRDCPYAGFCTAGCPGTVMAQTGELNARDPMSCYRIHLGEDLATKD